MNGITREFLVQEKYTYMYVTLNNNKQNISIN